MMYVVYPHVAFYNPSTPPKSCHRESIECVSLVLYLQRDRDKEYEEVCDFFPNPLVRWTKDTKVLFSETPSSSLPKEAFSFQSEQC